VVLEVVVHMLVLPQMQQVEQETLQQFLLLKVNQVEMDTHQMDHMQQPVVVVRQKQVKTLFLLPLQQVEVVQEQHLVFQQVQ
tara:strand:- start:232 stop:477 length:246 start_codon:yes stop_codon:yes gene_type:complete